VPWEESCAVGCRCTAACRLRAGDCAFGGGYNRIAACTKSPYKPFVGLAAEWASS
jgi:hypothetical protein